MKATDEYFNKYQDHLLSGAHLLIDEPQISSLQEKLAFFKEIKEDIEKIIRSKKYTRCLESVIKAASELSEELKLLTHKSLKSKDKVNNILYNNKKLVYINELVFFFNDQLHNPFVEE
jgi:hypothetical protein